MRIPTTATLMLRVRLASGERVYYPAAKHPNGKLKPNVAFVPRGPKLKDAVISSASGSECSSGFRGWFGDFRHGCVPLV